MWYVYISIGVVIGILISALCRMAREESPVGCTGACLRGNCNCSPK